MSEMNLYLSLKKSIIKAKAVRMKATDARENTWFAVQEIAVNRPVGKVRSQQVTTAVWLKL